VFSQCFQIEQIIEIDSAFDSRV